MAAQQRHVFFQLFFEKLLLKQSPFFVNVFGDNAFKQAVQEFWQDRFDQVSVDAAVDAGLGEGIYMYTITAVDRAGGESEPTDPVRIRVDLKPPEAWIRIDRKSTRLKSSKRKRNRMPSSA